MTIEREETTHFPTTPKGTEMALEYVKRLKEQGCYAGEKVGTETWTVYARYRCDVEE